MIHIVGQACHHLPRGAVGLRGAVGTGMGGSGEPERVENLGYPLGPAGDEIPEFARVIGVADAFDVMTFTRPYRKAWPVGEAVRELRRCSGSQFDPVMVEAFLRALELRGWETEEGLREAAASAERAGT